VEGGCLLFEHVLCHRGQQREEREKKIKKERGRRGSFSFYLTISSEQRRREEGRKKKSPCFCWLAYSRTDEGGAGKRKGGGGGRGKNERYVICLRRLVDRIEGEEEEKGKGERRHRGISPFSKHMITNKRREKKKGGKKASSASVSSLSYCRERR